VGSANPKGQPRNLGAPTNQSKGPNTGQRGKPDDRYSRGADKDPNDNEEQKP